MLSISRLPLRLRLLVPIMTLSVIIFSVMTLFSAKKARDLVSAEAEIRLGEESRIAALEIQKEINSGLTLALSMGAQLNDELQFNLTDRLRLVRMIRAQLDANKDLLGTWIASDPNAFDGKDAEYVNKEFHDKTGRFIPWYARVQGELKFKTLDTEGPTALEVSDYYTVPMKRGKPTVMAPYVDDVDGKPTTMTSYVIPLKKKDKVIGVVGVDVHLGQMQKIVESLKPTPGSEAYLISGEGKYVSHPDTKLLTKDASFEFYSDEIFGVLKSGTAFRKIGKDGAGVEYFINAIPFSMGPSEQTWMLVLKTPADEVLGAVRALTIIMVVSSVLGLLAMLIVVALIGRAISKVLTHISQELGESSDSVTQAIEQLSIAGVALSHSSSSSAASLEETVASLEELTSMVKMNSDNAKQAAALSASSTDSAVKGESEMQELVSAMHEIGQSSKKIEEIINVIDDIAFQTNLLALNASVEAARAGEHGKGFAVVADAVRTLAQRSASAAKDITSLIRESVERIERGTQRADRTGDVLKAIVTSIKKVSDLNNEIATASEEQSHGIGQISSAMNQLDQTVQSNAASSEQIASTAEEIRNQARVMNFATSELRVVVYGGVMPTQEEVSAEGSDKTSTSAEDSQVAE